MMQFRNLKEIEHIFGTFWYAFDALLYSKMDLQENLWMKSMMEKFTWAEQTFLLFQNIK